MNNNENNIKQIIDAVINRYSLKGKLTEVRIKELWREIVGDYISKHTISLRYYHGKLFVNLDIATLKTELLYKRTKILQEMNKSLGEKLISEIVIK